LIVTGGPQDGASVACEDGAEKVLGSATKADLRMTAANVAGSHARVKWTGEHLLLTDAGGPTGTFVNGEKITEPYPLSEGDRVYLGPPGSSDSVSLLVCPPVEERADSFLFDASPPESDDAAPLVLDEPAVAPAFDFLAPSPSPTPSRTPPAPAPAPEPEPKADEPIRLKPISPAPARKPQKADYTSEMPSIGGDRVREPVRLPPSPRPRSAPARKSGPSLPIPAIVGGVVLLLAGLGGAYYMFGLGVPKPVLTGVTPLKSEPGGTVSLSGEGFAPDAAGNTVLFGDAAGEVLSGAETKISAKIPADAPLGTVQVSVKTRGGRSSTVALQLARTPHADAIEPGVALPGGEVTITGGLLDGPSQVVTIGGRDAEILSKSASSLRVRVPVDLPPIEGKTVAVSVQVGGETAKSLTLMVGRLPMITDVSPITSAAAASITVRGFGFGATPTDNIVRFGEKRAVVLQAKPTEMVVVAPGSDRSGSQVTVELRVDAGGSTSSPRQFILTRSSSGSFVPRFYPEAVLDHPGHDHVLVSSDIGPLMILTGPGDAPSTGQRALAVAEALNAIVDGSFSGKQGAVEAREKPAPCVAVVGAPGCLATVTAKDVAAYDEKWATEKGGRPNPKLLAAYWAALIEDELSLFVRKQRPFRVLEASTRGKLLLEIYGEAARKVGAGNGVPTGLVSPVPMKWAGPLRDMALTLPTADGQGRSAAAIEGTWTGRAQDGGASREIRVRFHLDGSGNVQGALTTKRGKLSMDVPLTDVVYEKGNVRCVALLSGQPTTFSGTLQQGAITGTLQVPSKPAGQFSLSFVE